MTNDPIDKVIEAYLDHLEKGAPEPSLEDLSPGERELVQDIINSLEAGQGINPFLSRPSYSALVANTEFDVVDRPDANAGLTIDTIRAEVIASLGSASSPVVDGTAQNEGIRSDALVQFQALHIRLQYLDEVTTPADLALVDPQVAAGAVFGRFPDTAALVLVINDGHLSSVAIDAFDTEPFIGTPDGVTYPPRLTRPVLSLHDTLRRLVDELAPDLSVGEDLDDHEPLELLEVIKAQCAIACAAIRAEGAKARIEAKKDSWTDFGLEAFLESLTQDAAADGISDEDIGARVEGVLAA